MQKPLGSKVSIAAFFHHEAAGGILLMIAAAAALLLCNSRFAPLYDTLLGTPVSVRIGALALDKPLLLWINDGLMAIFFCLVGLEIKRELVIGELSSRDKALLPLLAAVGGMVVPALVYLAFNGTDPVAVRGWAVPSATDIAFAIGVLALAGPRVPVSLKVFLLALAIIDDLGAIIIIALFYTADLSGTALALATMGAIVLLAMNLRGVTRVGAYAVVGVFIWVCVLKSGIHATLAGVLVGLAVPLRGYGPDDEAVTPLETLEDTLHPWVTFAILPVFGFANAGIPLAGVSLARLLDPIPLGIALGLFLGKQMGVLGITWGAVRLGICAKPEGASWTAIWGAAVLAGIGFTMSLFIGTLAFPDPAHATDLRLGVLGGSLLSAVLGYALLRLPGKTT